jgi:hypothetical protein
MLLDEIQKLAGAPETAVNSVRIVGDDSDYVRIANALFETHPAGAVFLVERRFVPSG